MPKREYIGKDNNYLQKLKQLNNALPKCNHGTSHRVLYCIICKASLNKKTMCFPPPAMISQNQFKF